MTMNAVVLFKIYCGFCITTMLIALTQERMRWRKRRHMAILPKFGKTDALSKRSHVIILQLFMADSETILAPENLAFV